MIHVILRIVVWALVIGMGYLILGPELFDSSRIDNPFQSEATLYLPPQKSPRLIEYEQRLQQGMLAADDLAEYQALLKERQAGFWKGSDMTVEQALAGVNTQRKAHLATLLKERGLSDEELGVFFAVVQRDSPALLKDRD